jgi:Mn2+/Fe2+ NRAMP family transporter
VVIAASTVIGLLINFANIDPIIALVYSAMINGVIAAPILIAVMKIANDKTILKEKVNGKAIQWHWMDSGNGDGNICCDNVH